MNKKYYKYYPLMLLLLAFPPILRGQASNEFPKAEKLALFTDRGIYISGEEVHFTAFVTNHATEGLSYLLYAEIIEPDGIKIIGGKFPLIHSAAHGCLTIPSESITGNYYLRVYTKYMRNLGPESFAYVGLKIFNPHKSDLLEGKDTLKVTSGENIEKSLGHILKVSTDKATYFPREKANVTVKTSSSYSGKILGLSISVIPEATAPEIMFNKDTVTRKVDSIRFFPENRGPSLTGVLRDSATKKPEIGARVNLSITGNRIDFQVAKTDKNGHFYFSLPSYSGDRDLFIAPKNIPGKHPKIFVDNDFSTVPIHLYDPIFKVDSSEQSVAFHLAQNFWVRQLFYNDSIRCNKETSKSVTILYKEPSYTLKINKYIQLPTLEAYLDNLPSPVKVRKSHGKKYLKIVNLQPQMDSLDPLVLIDGVAIDDPEKVLALSPTNISRIDVVNIPYKIGDMKYSSIVNIVSKKGDFAGIDLPGSGMFLNYGFLHDNCPCAIMTPDSLNQPDTRNTLYWNPDVDLNSENEIHFSFTTADTPGKYAIVLQGIDADGKSFMK
ncbi:MAG: hypothetical protein IH595_08215, partial [Bacteroidales bacterium]|nr:hypothetical protein [Bacteroidales bacterium]